MSLIRTATAVADWVEYQPHPYVDCKDDTAAIPTRIWLPRTIAGDPDVRKGATVVYALDGTGKAYALGCYLRLRLEVVSQLPIVLEPQLSTAPDPVSAVPSPPGHNP